MNSGFTPDFHTCRHRRGRITMHIMRKKLGLDGRRLSGMLRIWIAEGGDIESAGGLRI